MNLRWSLRARRDLVEIGSPIAQEDPYAARRWLERLRKRARATLSQPQGGRRVPELGREEIREVFPSRTYRIVYRVEGDEIHVLTVFQGHRLATRSSLPERELPSDVQWMQPSHAVEAAISGPAVSADRSSDPLISESGIVAEVISDPVSSGQEDTE
jgi:plasmid stabilization system protein ParE